MAIVRGAVGGWPATKLAQTQVRTLRPGQVRCRRRHANWEVAVKVTHDKWGRRIGDADAAICNSGSRVTDRSGWLDTGLSRRTPTPVSIPVHARPRFAIQVWLGELGDELAAAYAIRPALLACAGEMGTLVSGVARGGAAQAANAGTTAKKAVGATREAAAGLVQTARESGAELVGRVAHLRTAGADDHSPES